jgi:hypothetical protein
MLTYLIYLFLIGEISMSKQLPDRPLTDIPPFSRRMDSIAWLIQGDEQCGAVGFDGKSLLLATNSQEQTEYVQATMAYLQQTAIEAQALEPLMQAQNKDEIIDKI